MTEEGKRDINISIGDLGNKADNSQVVEKINEKTNCKIEEGIINESTDKKENNEDKKELNMNEDFQEIEQFQDGIYMRSEIVDQVNTNQQSNMTLSAYSVITQSACTVKFVISKEDEVSIS